MALEVSGSYTYTLSDDFDGRTDVKGNDWLFAAGVSVVFGRFAEPAARPMARPAPAPAPPPPPPAPVVVDTDGDGLTDDDERNQHGTNPMVTDSDMDGLSDGAEVQIHGTDPNRADSDDDGMSDGEEIAAGRDALAADAPAPLPAEKALPLEMRTVSFGSGGTRMSETARAVLDDIVAHLVAHPGVKLILRGYADSQGPEAPNLRLSRQRAEVVRDFLVAGGVEARRLTVEAYGEADPIADNNTAPGRRANRRVELQPQQ